MFSTGERGGLPSGLLTVMFTDLEDSTALWELDAGEMRRVMNVHDDVLRRAVTAHDGVVFKNTGDGIGAVFASPSRAVDAAVTIQRQLQRVPWRTTRPRVRIGLHVGDITPTRGDYYGAPVNRAARIMDVANGDQITVSDEVAAFIETDRVIPVGQHELRGIGVEPINLVAADDLVQDERPLRARAMTTRRSLPASATRSIGRTNEIDALVKLLERRRIINLIGPGGVGKTHVAMTLGRQVEHRYQDGAVLVELASLHDGSEVPAAVASTLGARVQPGLDLIDSIVDFVSDRELLLVLDNCEHVADAAAHLIERLIGAPGVVIVATSRASLGLSQEQTYSISPITEADAVELFIDRAAIRDPEFAPGPQEREHIAAIGEAVDFIPLGIELAAAWVRVLSLAEIAARLRDSVDVAQASAEHLSRHETLHAAIAWSYRELDDREARLFDRLSVFVGGFTLEAVQAVCIDAAVHRDAGGSDSDNDDALRIVSADVPALVMALLDKSMIIAERHGDTPRFVMLRTLQHFGAESLARRGEAGSRSLLHAEHVAGSVKAASNLLVSHREHDAWEFFDTEWSNIRQAFARLRAAGRLADASQLLLDLGWYSTLSLRSETFAWADELLSTPTVESLDSHGSLLGLRAIHRYFSVDAGSRADAERGLIVDSSDPYGYCRIALGAVWVKNQHVPLESDGWTIEWLASLDEGSPAMSRLWAHGMRSFHLCVHEPSSAEAQHHVRTIERLAAETGSVSAEALARWSSGMLKASAETGQSGELRAALDDWRIGRELADSLSAMHLVAHLITSLELHFTAEDGDIADALELCRDALDRAREHHYLAGTSHLFGVTAILLARVGRADLGGELFSVMQRSGDVPRKNAVDALDEVTDLGLPTRSQRWPNGKVQSIDEAAHVASMALAEALERCES